MLGLFLGGLLSEGGIIARNFVFQNGLISTMKPAITLRKQPKTASLNSQLAYIWEGLLSEEFFNLRIFCLGGGGGEFFSGGPIFEGAYYRNFTVHSLCVMMQCIPTKSHHKMFNHLNDLNLIIVIINSWKLTISLSFDRGKLQSTC